MNSFLYTAMAFCVVSSCALAQYQSSGYGGGYSQQRKMAPTPQTYGQQQQAAAVAAAASSYGSDSGYEQQQQPSSAAMSQYDERSSASSSYGRQQQAAAPAYGRQASSGYGQQQAASSYAKQAAPKYEEPYHPPMPFAWGYDINDGYGGAQFHKENGDEYGKRTGSYGYTDAYGIYRQVDYVADEQGFRATIKTNEPGTANESPADVELQAYEPPSNYYAGNTGSSYGASAAKSSYGSSGSSYGAASSVAPTIYSAATPATPSYSQQQPRAQSYNQRSSTSSSSSSSSSYAKQPSSSSYGSASRSSGSYSEPAAQYASSVIVPVFQKANTATLTAAPAIPKALIAAVVPAKGHL